VKACNNFCPPTWTGHWRDWHRGHDCQLDPANANLVLQGKIAAAEAELVKLRNQQVPEPPSAQAEPITALDLAAYLSDSRPATIETDSPVWHDVIRLLREQAERLRVLTEQNGKLDADRASWRRVAEGLQRRIAALENDLADALDLKNGCGPTVLTTLVAERDELEAQNRALREALNGLHGAIMNVPNKPKGYGERPEEWRRGYGFGHKDARHAAAELAAAALATPGIAPATPTEQPAR
jgi:hypothetical protein